MVDTSSPLNLALLVWKQKRFIQMSSSYLFYLLTHERVLRDAVAEEDVETIDHPAHLGGGGQGLVNEGEGELVKHRGLAPGLLLLQRAVGGQPVGPGAPHAAADQWHADEQQQEAEAGGGDDDESLPGEAGGHPHPRHHGRGGGPPHQLAAGQDLPLVTVGPRHLQPASCVMSVLQPGS